MNIVVTGANGFIGKNLVASLEQQGVYDVCCFGHQDDWAMLTKALEKADFVFHLAGVNRPKSEDEFRTGNVEFTVKICKQLMNTKRKIPLLLTSSIQALQKNPYGVSKHQAEEVVVDYAKQSGARVAIYRLPNVFGKWCRPNYNSVVATFCFNIAHDLPITISDPSHQLTLVHVDDVIGAFLAKIKDTISGISDCAVSPSYQVTLGRLADSIYSFRQMRQTLHVPDLSEDLTHKLYSTYLSYLEPNNFAYNLDKKSDVRGNLAEFMKSPTFGQIFLSRTAPGITRGNHYHHLKTEKFLVVEGEAIIRLRHIRSEEIIEYRVCGTEFRVVDIPPGYTHSIENVGIGELVTLFWASEMFLQNRPDTYAMPVR